MEFSESYRRLIKAVEALGEHEAAEKLRTEVCRLKTFLCRPINRKPSTELISCFVWMDTLDGYSYWENIYKKLKKQEETKMDWTKSDLTGVKPGDKIWTSHLGEVKVTGINRYTKYPIMTRHDSGRYENYTYDGKKFTADKYPTAWKWCPFPGPEPKEPTKVKRIVINGEKVIKNGEPFVKITEVDALERDDLPSRYFHGIPRVYRDGRSLHFAWCDSSGARSEIISEGDIIRSSLIYELKSIAEKAGKRLDKINKEIIRLGQEWYGEINITI